MAPSAVPAGTQARLLLTYARLVEGGRLLGRRRVSWPEHKVRKGEKAATVPAGYPAQRGTCGSALSARATCSS